MKKRIKIKSIKSHQYVNMLKAVTKADVIIVNPTHYAIALRYDERKDEAPEILAKGVDIVAIKIKEIAMNHDIPIIQYAQLARALYIFTQVELQLPEILYEAVAEVLAFVWKTRKIQIV